MNSKRILKLVTPSVVLAAAWILLIRTRPFFIHTSCASQPEACNPLALFSIDRWALGKDSSFGEELSLATQYASGTLVIFVPLVFHLVKSGRNRRAALVASAEDILLIAQAILINGLCTELARLVFQRPRPFVYGNPGFYGTDPQNYTSFFSGHTSFATVSNVALVLVLLSRKAPRRMISAFSVIGAAIILATAVGRVTAGRHFVTDVIVGAIAGATVALLNQRVARSSFEVSI